MSDVKTELVSDELKVNGQKGSNKNDRKKLALAISTVLTKHPQARLRCVGAASLYNAVFAFSIASIEAAKNGKNLALTSEFGDASFGDGIEKTCLILTVSEKNV